MIRDCYVNIIYMPNKFFIFKDFSTNSQLLKSQYTVLLRQTIQIVDRWLSRTSLENIAF